MILLSQPLRWYPSDINPLWKPLWWRERAVIITIQPLVWWFLIFSLVGLWIERNLSILTLRKSTVLENSNWNFWEKNLEKFLARKKERIFELWKTNRDLKKQKPWKSPESSLLCYGIWNFILVKNWPRGWPQSGDGPLRTGQSSWADMDGGLNSTNPCVFWPIRGRRIAFVSGMCGHVLTNS